ncbi:hypothetical protein ROJ8625_03428 [Roseivivax jejudonensis]|uniref:Dihydrodipicolinate reductase n=1 Tax=Roseivivax jejudonensis TaxID=1529041 RepID=A0A1X7A0H3_9RHOB|nr:dihydrodipicolinate reductase [Roseivivax jejudonensis]SLN67091.1 hypothetical protein ROJ8625_03428 [Roseivivax jejudonensis]
MFRDLIPPFTGRRAAAMALAALTATPALADMSPVTDRARFLELVQGRTLSRPLVNLQVGADGTISGSGAGWNVSGSWSWQDGYFCRDLNWGGDDLGYNCQLVTADGDRIRFTEDRGAGRTAGFTLN